MENGPRDEKCERFKDYIVTNWVDYGARFPLSIWNHSDTIGQCQPRTNNHLEGWHHHLNQTIRHSHPNIFELITVLKSFEATNIRRMAQSDLGAPGLKRKRKYVELDNRLSRLQQCLRNGSKTPMQFIDAAGRLIKLS